jgi:protein-S-isoprenylcysteine O-methyltransferase Ste14
MARATFKTWWTTVIPQPIERSTYVLLASLLFLLLFWQWRPIGGVVWQVDQPIGHALLLGLYALGWVVAVLSIFLINHFELFGLKQVYDNLVGKSAGAGGFKTPLLYQVVRHPLMVGLLIAFWATPRMTFGHVLFALMTTVYIVIGVHFEERDLVQAFGETYTTYQRQVFRFLPWPRRK